MLCLCVAWKTLHYGDKIKMAISEILVLVETFWSPVIIFEM